jgi:hypothetical protein
MLHFQSSYLSQTGNFQGYRMKLSGAGAGAAIRICGRSRKKYFRLRNTALNILDIHECFGPWHLLKIFI